MNAQTRQDGRMMTYAWFDTEQALGETKFGDHFVPGWTTLDEAIEHTMKYIRSQFPRRGPYFDSQKVLKMVWDVSEIAKAKKKFYGHSGIDNVIRDCIPGMPGTQGREFHAVSFDIAVHAVNTYIARSMQALPLVGLTQWQYNDIGEMMLAINGGKRTFMAELCARYGKTLQSGALILESGARLSIVASYVLSSFASFAKDLSSFNQFRNFEIVDSASKTYEADVHAGLAAGRQVVVFMSMCNGTKRQERLDFLFSLPHNRLVLIDEADFGAHTSNTADAFVKARKPDDVVVLMTGTNGDRASGKWAVDYYLSKTYPELIMVKRGLTFGTPQFVLRHFEVNSSRHVLIPDVAFYQLGLIRLIEQAGKFDPELFVEGDDRMPSWTKFAKNPLRAKGFWIRMLQAVFDGQHSLDELNIDFQVKKALGKNRVAMMFLSGSMKNECLAQAAELARQALPSWEIFVISGDERVGAKKMTNEMAEAATKRVVDMCQEAGKPLLILSRGMAQRSYSVGEISELYLCFDGGDVGATTQKISRALTAKDEGKIGRIFSLSFDPNRDDKFDCALIAAAQNYKKANGVEITEALRQVISTLDIFACTENGSVRIDLDTYLAQVLERNSLSRMVGQQADLSKLSFEDIKLLADGETGYDTMNKTEKAEKGKAHQPSNIKKPKDQKPTDERESAAMLNRARGTLVAIVEYMPYLMIGTACSTIRETLLACRDQERRQYVLDSFNVSPEKILELFDRGILNYDLTSLQKAATVQVLQNP
jgi:hypothetical protein